MGSLHGLRALFSGDERTPDLLKGSLRFANSVGLSPQLAFETPFPIFKKRPRSKNERGYLHLREEMPQKERVKN